MEVSDVRSRQKRGSKRSYVLVPLWLIGVPLPAMMVLYLLFH
jgi:hypothetical protein